MGNMLSPGVQITERDLSLYTPAVSSSIGAFVGQASRGPVYQKTLVTNERELVELFGEPTDDNYKDFFTAASFLSYTNTLYFTRVVSKSTAKNAMLVVEGSSTPLSATSTPLSGAGAYLEFHNENEIFGASGTEFTPAIAGATSLEFYSKYPGAYTTEDVKIVIINKATYDNLANETSLSGYSNVIEDSLDSNDEFYIFVLALDQGVTPSTYVLTEKFKVSTTSTKLDNSGNSMYVETVINRSSKYLIVYHTSSASYLSPKSCVPTLMTSGSDGSAITSSQIMLGWDLYANKEEIEVDILIGGPNTAVTEANYILALALSRMDCVAILDFPESDLINVSSTSQAITNMVQYRSTELNANTSYGALYGNWYLIHDKYNDKKRWIPSGGANAGVFAYNDFVSDPWFAPAGLNRGILKNVIKLAINPNEAQRDTLYKNQINPIASFIGQGTVIWGQKTLQTKPSAFDRINVRRLFNLCERSIGKMAKYIVFEPNDAFTRRLFKNTIDPFLKDIQSRRGLYGFLVDVSETVNTPERVDRNEFWGEIYLSPVKAGEFVKLRFNATRTGVNFEELVGQ